MNRKIDLSGFTTDEIEKASKPSAGGQLILGGDYVGRIVDVEDSEFAKQGAHAGYPALRIEFQIIESGTGEGVGQKITHFRVPLFTRYNNEKKSPVFQFFQFVKALGLEPKGADFEFPSNEDLLAQDVGLKIGYQDPRAGRGKQYASDERIYNEITGFFPVSNGLTDNVIPYPTNIASGGGGGFGGGGSAPAASSGDTSNPWTV